MHTKHIYKQNLARPNIRGETDVLFEKKTESKFRREHHMKMSRTYSLVIPLQTYSMVE